MKLGRWAACLCAFGISAMPALGQCKERWLPGEGIPAVNGSVQDSIMWDPDGAGPRKPVLVVGGSFRRAGKYPVLNVAMWDAEAREWLPMGDGLAITVTCLAVLPSGELFAGGYSNSTPPHTPNRVFRWDGGQWTAIHSGSSPIVLSLTGLTNGDLVMGGQFESINGVTARNIARYRNGQWMNITEGVPHVVPKILELPNGQLAAVVGSGNGLILLSRWDGNMWTPFAPSYPPGWTSLAAASLGDGRVMIANGQLAIGNGGPWTMVDLLGSVSFLDTLPNGDVIAGGSFQRIGGVAARDLARWDGTTWHQVGAAPRPNMTSISQSPDGIVYLSSWLTDYAPTVQQWDGSTWSTVGTGLDNLINAMAVSPEGKLTVGGWFVVAGSGATRQIAEWDGVTWSSLGTGAAQGYPRNSIASLAYQDDGSLLAGGFFETMNGVAARNVARYQNGSWTTMGEGLSGGVDALLVRGNGDVIAGGAFGYTGAGVSVNHVARWTGSQWVAVGPGFPGSYSEVFALAELPNGDLYAGGRTTLSSSMIARWNGTAWTSLTPGTGGRNVFALAAFEGDLIVGGDFLNIEVMSAARVARWNGQTWSAMGGGIPDRAVQSLKIGPDGKLYAGSGSVYRWNGSDWERLGSGMTPIGAESIVKSIAFMPSGELAAGGWFATVDGLPSAYFARWTGTGQAWIAQQPESVSVARGGTAQFSARPAMGYSDLSYRWLRDGVPLVNGAGGASAGGGTVNGAMGVTGANSTGQPIVLTLAGVRHTDMGRYSLELFNSCGASMSAGANLTVTGTSCYANCDNSTMAPVLNALDFQCYVNKYANGDSYANCDGSSVAPVLNANDFMCFLNAYSVGCP